MIERTNDWEFLSYPAMHFKRETAVDLSAPWTAASFCRLWSCLRCWIVRFWKKGHLTCYLDSEGVCVLWFTVHALAFKPQRKYTCTCEHSFGSCWGPVPPWIELLPLPPPQIMCLKVWFIYLEVVTFAQNSRGNFLKFLFPNITIYNFILFYYYFFFPADPWHHLSYFSKCKLKTGIGGREENPKTIE